MAYYSTKQLQAFRKLGLSDDEIAQLEKDDKAIDKMSVSESYSDLSKEERKAVKTMCATGTKQKTEKKVSKVVKNEAKSAIISQLFTFLSQNIAENAEITNETRSIAFKIGEKSYDLTLVEHRTAKK